MRMTQIFNESTDYLIFDKRSEKDQVSIADRELVQKLSEIDKLSEQDKAIVKELDTFIIKSRFQWLAAPRKPAFKHQRILQWQKTMHQVDKTR